MMQAYKKKLFRRARFLTGVDEATPWEQHEHPIESCCPEATGAGRRPIGVSHMRRMHAAQQCLGLSDEGIEDATYDSAAIRDLVGVDPNWGAAPDAPNLTKLCRLLEAHDLARRIFEIINAHLAAQGMMMREGMNVDATLIAAPPSTNNECRQRDPEMHQSKKGNDWLFGMEAHIGTDATSGLVHTLTGMAGNVADVAPAHALLHDAETIVLADAGCQGVAQRIENKGHAVRWHVAMKRTLRKALPTTRLGHLREQLEVTKARVRAKVEHPFHVVKNLCRHRKTRYRGLAKNTTQLFTLFGLANRVPAGRRSAVRTSRTC